MAFLVFLMIIAFFFGDNRGMGKAIKDLFVVALIFGAIALVESSFYWLMMQLGVAEPQNIILMMIKGIFFFSTWDLIFGVMDYNYVWKFFIFGVSILMVPILLMVFGAMIAGWLSSIKVLSESALDKIYKYGRIPAMVFVGANGVVLMVRTVYSFLMILYYW
ncbi:hypothetical protein J7I80_05710 [Bacillus sp. ISL-41]|uniref:hypothetical protein n=1 Tax=Bacillus sp. ISL-41 TaxID=2819127 RepID=UPI001BE8B368|nr:hypothetical protein [Bacillus sp. ISL-41]MBT2641711.1 hypothetical protein [Bacillus sp. ISL-41]